MYDPMIVAHEIPYPWRKYLPWPKGLKYEDISIYERHRFSEFWKEGYRETFITIWHVDPETDGTDESCGWFMRAHHGNKEVLERIVKRYEHDWDRVFTSDSGTAYDCGYFYQSGDPHFSVPGIVLNLFFLAACEHFNVDGRSNWTKARRWMQTNLFDILHFAENPTDSLFDAITRKYEHGCNELYTPRRREESIRKMAQIIYGWILRETRPWWKHPRWHVHHWKIQCHPLQDFKRWAFSRCCKCGKRFKFGESPCTDSWNNGGPRWFRSETNTYHTDCSRPGAGPSCAKEESTPV